MLQPELEVGLFSCVNPSRCRYINPAFQGYNLHSMWVSVYNPYKYMVCNWVSLELQIGIPAIFEIMDQDELKPQGKSQLSEHTMCCGMSSVNKDLSYPATPITLTAVTKLLAPLPCIHKSSDRFNFESQKVVSPQLSHQEGASHL